MRTTRHPDFFVLAESGNRVPCFLQGQYRADQPHILIGFEAGRSHAAPFLINALEHRLMTWSGTLLDIPIEPTCNEVWEVLTDH